MRRIHLIGLLLVLCVAGAPAYAQDSADDQAAVWAVVEEIWAAEQSGDVDWVDDKLSADFMGWPGNSPAPRSRASTRMWARFNSDQSKGLIHELYPLSIVVHGNMAVVHYLYTMVVQTKEREAVRTNGRYTDVLVRDDGGWKFISWHGGDD